MLDTAADTEEAPAGRVLDADAESDKDAGSALRLHLALAAVVYLPLVVTQPGWVSADTKTYFYLDPSRLLSRAWSMWDPTYAAGTVTHQSIGFLWPTGPFYWLAETLGLPDWLAQRLWWGSILFLAGAGVAYLLRTLGWRVPGPGATAAVFVYALTPYSLALMARLSGLLLPFSGLPWLLALTIRAQRHRGWRYPALFALAVATFGSVNATALLLTGVAPVLWLVWSVVAADRTGGARAAAARRAVLTAAKLGVLTVAVSAWWIAGLSVQATNGIEIIRYTETAEVVAHTSTSHEVLRGLGYWFFYGTDRLGPWIEPSVHYTQWLPIVTLSYLLPLLAFGGAAIARWRHRGYFVALVVAGTALAVGAFPRDHNPPFGRLVQLFQSSDVGLAMRSLPRAVPLVALGLALLLGAGAERLGRFAGVAVAVLAVVTLPALWLGQFVPDNLRRPEDVPQYWRDAARYLDQRGDGNSGTRVLVVPGSDFASYRWGNTVDPILPGLMDRPSVQRELAPYGSPASVNLLNAFDLTLQERTADPDALARIARLMRAGDVLLVSDWQYERYNTPRPRNLWDVVSNAPGLGSPERFGPGRPNRTVEDVQLDDEVLLQTDPAVPDPPELAAFPVPDTMPLVATHATSGALLVAGDGAGLVDAAGAGLIDGNELVRYSATLDRSEVAAALDDGAALLVTDTNRKRGERWSGLRHNRGHTETPDGGPLATDLTDNRMPTFASAIEGDEPPIEAMTVVERRPGGHATDATGTTSTADATGTSDAGGTTSARSRVTVEAEATSYGNSITYSPQERASYAVDGDPDTAWRTAGFADARGERLELRLSRPLTTDHVQLLQAFEPPTTRFVARARLTFSNPVDDTGPVGETSIDVDLSGDSRREPGQVVRFPERTFSRLSIEVLSDSAGYLPRYAGQSSVGFAEIAIDGVQPVEETVRLPTDLLDAAGAASEGNPLAFGLTRQRQDATDPTRDDEEPTLDRLLSLPTDRSFSLSGTARLSARADPWLVDELLGRPHDGSVPWVRAASDIAGSVVTPAAAFDGDPTTAWTTDRSRPRQWVEVVLPEPVTVDRLPLTVVADGLHSVPTEVELWVDGRRLPDPIDVPEIRDGDRQNATTEVVLDVPRVTGSRFRLQITEVREQRTNDWVTDRSIAQSTAVAEIGLPAATVPVLPGSFDSGCREDLLSVDGRPIPIRITGSTADALQGRPLTVTTCQPDGPNARGAPPPSVDLAAGQHRLQSQAGLDSGIDVDQLVLRSAAGGAASSNTSTLATETAAATPAAAEGPRIEVTDDGPNDVRLRVSGSVPGEPFWLVLGQSFNPGWQASVEGHTLGRPELVDGFANGWLVDPRHGDFDVELSFTPQRRVDIALWLSAASALACLVLASRPLWGRRRKPTAAATTTPTDDGAPPPATEHEPPSRTSAWLTGLGVALLAWALAGPGLGLVVGVAAAVTVRRDDVRRYLLLVGPTAMGVVIAYVLYIQVRHGPEPSFDWPHQLQRVHPLGWLAVLLLAADTVVDHLRRHEQPEQAPEPRPSGSNPGPTLRRNRSAGKGEATDGGLGSST